MLPDFYISDFSENEESSDGEPSGNFTILRNRRVTFLRNMRPNNSINYNTERPQVDYNKNFPNPLIKNRRKRADNSNNMAGQSRISHYENKVVWGKLILIIGNILDYFECERKLYTPAK